MSGAVETAELIEPWIYSQLTGDVLLADVVGTQIYGPQEPDELYGPYVTVQMVSNRDVVGVGVHRIQVSALYQVKVTVEGYSQDPILPAVKRIFTLLDGITNATYEGGQITSMRDHIISYTDAAKTNRGSGPGGDDYTHLGGTFRLTATAAG